MTKHVLLLTLTLVASSLVNAQTYAPNGRDGAGPGGGRGGAGGAGYGGGRGGAGGAGGSTYDGDYDEAPPLPRYVPRARSAPSEYSYGGDGAGIGGGRGGRSGAPGDDFTDYPRPRRDYGPGARGSRGADGEDGASIGGGVGGKGGRGGSYYPMKHEEVASDAVKQRKAVVLAIKACMLKGNQTVERCIDQGFDALPTPACGELQTVPNSNRLREASAGSAGASS